MRAERPVCLSPKDGIIHRPSSRVERKRDGGEADRIGGRGAAYHAAVAGAFVCFAEAEPERFARIDGDESAEAVHAAVLAALARLLDSSE